MTHLTQPILVDEVIHLTDLLTNLVPDTVPLTIQRNRATGFYRASIGPTTWGEGSTVIDALLSLSRGTTASTAYHAQKVEA